MSDSNPICCEPCVHGRPRGAYCCRSGASTVPAASLVVWYTHRPVLRAAGYRMRSFCRACDAQYAFYLEPPKDAATFVAEPCSCGTAGNIDPRRGVAMITFLFLVSLAATISLLIAVAADEGVVRAFGA